MDLIAEGEEDEILIPNSKNFSSQISELLMFIK
jgi:hypothetical protein